MFFYHLTLEGAATNALLAGVFTWLMTALGALAIIPFRRISEKVLSGMLGLAAGVMVSASFWSLLAPSVDLSAEAGNPWLPAVTGFLLGGVLIRALDVTIPHIHLGVEKAEGRSVTWSRRILLVAAVTLHNVPEGLAIGVVFGAITVTLNAALTYMALGAIELSFATLSHGASFASAAALTLGIGLQNLPEGFAISMPLRAEGFTTVQSIFYGQLSAVVEPIFAVIGAATVLLVSSLLPYVMSLAAGAMIFVSVEELIPESQKNPDLATASFMIGFAAMMLLDVAFTI
ncbi:MAG: ZIP family metal transporter [Candidatus Jordarchaeales archaeon]